MDPSQPTTATATTAAAAAGRGTSEDCGPPRRLPVGTVFVRTGSGSWHLRPHRGGEGSLCRPLENGLPPRAQVTRRSAGRYGKQDGLNTGVADIHYLVKVPPSFPDVAREKMA